MQMFKSILKKISIPVRYDWNLEEAIIIDVFMKYFNSSKVRLELRSFPSHLQLYKISIPVRYDWNASNFRVPNLLPLYFNSSKVRLELSFSL